MQKTATFLQNPSETTRFSEVGTQNKRQNHEKEILFETETKYLRQSSGFGHPNITKNPSSKWSSLIKHCIFQGKTKQALLIYNRNRGVGNIILGAIPLALKACASLSMISLGQALHAESIKGGVEGDVMVGTSLVDMYGKCRKISYSRKMFDNMPERNVTTWNAMIGGYMKVGDLKSGIFLFEEMALRTSVTWNQMIDGLAKNGNMAMARQFFDRVPEELRTVVTWTVMVDGYASGGEMEAATEIFEMMPKRNFYVWSSMISGYFKKGKVEEAKAIFDRMQLRNLVNWNSLISGYAQNGLCDEALDAFTRMQSEGFEPDEFTLVSVLSACAQLGILDVGKKVHEMAIQKGVVQLNNFVLNGLVDMYAKCGDLINARLLFEEMPCKTTATWNALILGFAVHGQCKEAIKLFGRMDSRGEKPDNITFLAVLSACAHGGFVEKGLEIFSKMEKYGVTASIKHYGCIVDLLGRAGRIQEAYKLIKEMPLKPNETILGALLGACRTHGDTDMAERMLEEVDGLKCGSAVDDPVHYVLLSSIYAASEKWEQAEGMRVALFNKGSKKAAGCSTVMLESTESSFIPPLKTS
ncbi:pentatricopeptide repeat-containing protein At3g21470 [Coffea eugenioides]|uniref:Pentatricopeptide repeat-containing protein At3g21470-like n=1 Tax=Coffea arabica TaxID=13443 RepID=A0A6P6UR28_COFAR|nr:pentatricopeptide repeat-containing protein At3g21470-like [Coffea arabica]XP_027148520.1 pentatricopeptide repeat-containing protein At3g21470 [Coffea eugenioides]